MGGMFRSPKSTDGKTPGAREITAAALEVAGHSRADAVALTGADGKVVDRMNRRRATSLLADGTNLSEQPSGTSRTLGG